MELKVKLTRQDFLEFNKYIFFKKRLYKSLNIAIVFITLWIIILNYDQAFDLEVIFSELVLFSAFWAILMLITYWLSFNKIKKMPDEDGEILGEKTYIISEDGLKQVSENSETFIKWVGVKSFNENERYIFLFVDKIAAYVIPKRVFNTTSELDKFTELVKSKIK